MPTYCELLPPSKSVPNAAITWQPSTTARGGLLTISSRRDHTTYLVVELPCSWDGRAFHFAKVTEGSDPEAESYDVFAGTDPRRSTCQCRGYLRWSLPCKHISAARALWDCGWLDLANPEADTGATEGHERGAA